jgi:hypothetical protein
METFYFGVTTGKKATTMSCNLLMWFHYSKEEEDDNFCHLFQWLCCNKMATCIYFCGFAAKKVTSTMSSPSSMVVVLWRRQWLEAFFSPFFCGVFGLVH